MQYDFVSEKSHMGEPETEHESTLWKAGKLTVLAIGNSHDLYSKFSPNVEFRLLKIATYSETTKCGAFSS
jgi:hypothetical protein